MKNTTLDHADQLVPEKETPTDGTAPSIPNGCTAAPNQYSLDRDQDLRQQVGFSHLARTRPINFERRRVAHLQPLLR